MQKWHPAFISGFLICWILGVLLLAINHVAHIKPGVNAGIFAILIVAGFSFLVLMVAPPEQKKTGTQAVKT